jgi:hypothetical protein
VSGILANQPTAWLHKLHDLRSVEIATAGLGDDWPAGVSPQAVGDQAQRFLCFAGRTRG